MTPNAPPIPQKSGKLQRVVIVASVILLFVLAAIFVSGSLRTNDVVKRMSAFDPGTPFADVIAANGAPDKVEDVTGSWTYGRRARRLPENVTQVAIYHEATMPQVCAFLLDKKQTVVEILVFASY